MRVDIWSDVVCPWCYVGKARFDKALGSFAHRDQVQVVARAAEARRLGISGVPFFAFGMALGVSGAQPTETFTRAPEQAWAADR